MPTWPATLPAPMTESYSTVDQFPVLQTEMQSGPPRLTRYSNHYLTTGNAELVMDSTQYAIFRQLLIDSNLGTDWITDTPIDTGGGHVNHRIRIRQVERRCINQPDNYWQISLVYETDDHN